MCVNCDLRAEIIYIREQEEEISCGVCHNVRGTLIHEDTSYCKRCFDAFYKTKLKTMSRPDKPYTFCPLCHYDNDPECTGIGLVSRDWTQPMSSQEWHQLQYEMCCDIRERVTRRGRTPKQGYSSCCTCGQMKPSKVHMKCGSCKMAYYCSRKCQRDHWPSHKVSCKQLQKIQQGRPLPM